MDSPYMDFEDFNLQKGSTIGFKAVGGKLLYGTITSIERDRATGEVQIKVDDGTISEAPVAEADAVPSIHQRVPGAPTSQSERIAAAAVRMGRSIEWVMRATGNDQDAVAYFEANK